MANMVLFSSLCTKSSLLFSSHRLSCFFEHFLAITLTILSLLLSFRFHYYFVHPIPVSSSSQRASHPSASTSLSTRVNPHPVQWSQHKLRCCSFPSAEVWKLGWPKRERERLWLSCANSAIMLRLDLAPQGIIKLRQLQFLWRGLMK